MPLPSLQLTACLHVVGEPDPQLPARVLALVTVRSELPIHFRATLVEGERLEIEMGLPNALTLDERRLLVARVERIPTVISAAMTVAGLVRKTPPGGMPRA